MKDSAAHITCWKEDVSFRQKDEQENSILAEILYGCYQKRPSSQEMLYKKFYGYAMGIALKYCCNREDAREVTNDSFIKVFQHIKKFDPSAPFKPWFRRIVVNSSIDKIRTNKKFQHHLEIDDVREVYPVDIESDLSAEEAYNLLEKLPALHRCVFNMYEIDGYHHHEIAAMLEIPESSSRTYLTRAKTRLRQLYQKYELDSK